jgi:hypothetical protein
VRLLAETDGAAGDALSDAADAGRLALGSGQRDESGESRLTII